MLGILNFAAAPTAGTPQTKPGQGLSPEGQEAFGSFGALLAQIASGAAEGDVEGEGQMAQIAGILGQFREMAQDSLAEVFPDGVITPGPEFNDWAKSMLTKLDGMLQGIGASVADLAQVLAPMQGMGGNDAGTMLTQAAQTLLGDVAVQGGAVKTQAPGTPVVTGATPADAGVVQAKARAEAGVVQGASGQGVAVVEGGGATPTAGTPELSEEIRAVDPLTVRAETASSAAATDETNAGQSVAKMLAAGQAGGEGQTQNSGQGGQGAQSAAPLPDALRLLLAQAVAAPADRGLPPEIQTLLSAPQSSPPPVVATVAAAMPTPPADVPAQAQSNGFARNLAGQIRGVSFTEGTTRIELTPQGLGRLEIEIAPDEAGKLRVVIRAENPAVLNAMRSDREMLAGLLRDGGTTVDDGAMSFEDLGQRRGTPGQEEATGPAATLAAAPEDDDEQTEDPQHLAQDGRLNILT
ncbi:flagellar hook-length control protein FliK [Pseudooceanicola sp.]|uniref:flagellar hook-length control protein FliK n=1 Tax=Pseudooceanicola sp. TaxID=1914328 RepID=UPI0035C6EFF3